MEILILDEQDLINTNTFTTISQVQLDQRIESIVKLHKVDKSHVAHDDFLDLVINEKLAFGMFSPNGVEYITGTLQTFQNIKESLRLHDDVYSFNPETNMLYFNGNQIEKGDHLIIFGEIREAERNLYQSELLRKLLKANILRQWVINLSLKYNQEDANIIGNGLKLNTTFMDEYAQRLEDEIEQEITDRQFGDVLGVQRMF